MIVLNRFVVVVVVAVAVAVYLLFCLGCSGCLFWFLFQSSMISNQHYFTLTWYFLRNRQWIPHWNVYVPPAFISIQSIRRIRCPCGVQGSVCIPKDFNGVNNFLVVGVKTKRSHTSCWFSNWTLKVLFISYMKKLWILSRPPPIWGIGVSGD